MLWYCGVTIIITIAITTQKMPKCKVVGCLSDKSGRKVHRFHFPKESERLQRWFQFCGIPDAEVALEKKKNWVICSDHFRKDQWSEFLTCGRLDRYADPTLNGYRKDDSEKENDNIAVNIENGSIPMEVDGERNEACVNSVEKLVRLEEAPAGQKTSAEPAQENIYLLVNPAEKRIAPAENTIRFEVYPTKRKKFGPRKPHVPKEKRPIKKQRRRCFKKAKRELKRRIQQKKMPKDCLKDVKDSIEKHAQSLNGLSIKIHPNCFHMLDAGVRNLGKPDKSKKWTFRDKMLATSIYKKTPKGYRHLCRLVRLPSLRTLRRFCKRIYFSNSINNDLSNELSKKIELFDTKERNCVLMMGELRVQEGFSCNLNLDHVGKSEEFEFETIMKLAADHAMVFMVRGFNRIWKHQIAYYFSQGTTKASMLSEMIIKVCEMLFEIGLNPVATVCIKNPTTLEAFHNLSKSPKPFFTVNGKDIVYFFDSPHLLISMRNRLIRNNLRFTSENEEVGDVKWSYIQQFYEFDQSFCKTALKLTTEHINPSKMNQMNVTLAAQVFSHTVYSGMAYWAMIGTSLFEIQPTFSFIKWMDSLFDSFNGFSRSPKDGKTLQCRLTKDSGHFAFWDSISPILDKMKFIKANSDQLLPRAPCQQGWLHNIRAIKILWEKSENLGFKYIIMRHLNMEPLENLLNTIKLSDLMSVSKLKFNTE